jgi:diacylglycerol O-acyltransferase / wax synthase
VRDTLTSIEAIMWELGHEPTMRMTVGDLMILDRPPAHAALVARLAAAADDAPRLWQRPVVLGRMNRRPVWVDEPDFDPGEHVRRVAIPAPGDQRQVLDLITLLEPAPFDPERSPWDVTVIEGLEGGRGALYLRAHHVLTDGRGGVSLVNLLLDEARRPSPVTVEPALEATDAGGLRDRVRRPGTITMSIDLTRAARPVATGVTAALHARPLDAVARGAQQTLDLASSITRQLVVTGGRLSPLPPVRSMSSYFDALSVPGARAAALALGGSRNDLLVASAAAGLGQYHRALGYSCRELRLAMPASRHRDGDLGGNWFAPTRVPMPALAGHPGPQFGIVAERLSRARSEPAVRVAAGLASLISHVPPRALLPALHAQAHTVDFAATSLPGVRGIRHVCGAAIEENFPFGPRLGCLMNLTGFGNDDRLDVGIAIDPSAVAEPELLVACLADAFEGFVPKVRRAIVHRSPE